MRIKATGVVREYKVAQRSSGRNAKKLDEKIYKLAVLSSEVTCMSDLRTANANSGRVWKENYENLEQEKQRLYEGMVTEVRISQNERTLLQQQNADLKQCVKTYVAANGLSCRGSKIADIQTKSGKEKKIKNVRERAQEALYFLELFGLKVETLKVKDDKGENYNLNIGLSTLGNDEQQDDTNRSLNSLGYDALSESEKETVEELLFLLDKFGVGDEFYHEMTMAKYGEELPRSYLVKQLRSTLNRSCFIIPTLVRHMERSILLKISWYRGLVLNR